MFKWILISWHIYIQSILKFENMIFMEIILEMYNSKTHSNWILYIRQWTLESYPNSFIITCFST